MAVPKRVNLFRAQASRAVGGNGRRTSHNPPDPSMLQIYDRIGITVMDENRLFANETKYVTNMGALVKRDRNHPSVVIWSFCNEGGCEGARETGGPRFYEIADKYDGSRATLANMFTFGDLLSNTIDVQGFSHQVTRCHCLLHLHYHLLHHLHLSPPPPSRTRTARSWTTATPSCRTSPST